ncbi:hypothetical protein CSA56_04775 [candidate division KSB3 bacterium]|uniref:Glycosyl transferase family 1 n=1 Tax=candidate division KSB3 bacterium TaxID=2044937 RepID=A0A2G6KI11_9BACT|nr:MAG: hypothetical protein CSA56_04775 [candidate division KSB3 bacterium]
MDTIKIVFLIGTLEMGGTERQFIEMLRRLDRKRFVPHILSFRCQGRLREEIEALQVPFTCLHVQNTRGTLNPISYLRICKLTWDIYRYLKIETPHIVQSHLFWPNIHSCIAGKYAGVPVIITGRRATMSIHHQKFRKYTKWHYRWLQNVTNRWATAILVNSHIIKQHCLEREKFVTPERVHVLYNGIDPTPYTRPIDSIPIKKEFRLSHDANTVGMIATLHPRKGYRDFLEAAALVLQTYPDTIFLLIGRDDGIKSTLEEVAEKQGIRHAVLFTGERHDIPELLSVLDVQVSSSYIEGQSNAILEGMAAGKAIVATEAGGNPELILDGQTGLLVPPGNPSHLARAIVQLLGNQQQRKQLGEKARQRAATHFGIAEMVQQSEALYQTLVHTNISTSLHTLPESPESTCSNSPTKK